MASATQLRKFIRISAFLISDLSSRQYQLLVPLIIFLKNYSQWLDCIFW